MYYWVMEEFFSASHWIRVVISLVLVCKQHFHGSGDMLGHRWEIHNAMIPRFFKQLQIF